MADTIPGSTATTAALTINGGSFNSAVDNAGDEDWFRVTLTAGVSYTFQLNKAGTASLDPALILKDSSGGVDLAYNDDAPGGLTLNSLITYTPSASGTHYLVAHGSGHTSSGDYSISASSTAVSVGALSIAASNAPPAEGNSGVTAYKFIVSRSGNVTTSSSATWAVTGQGENPAIAADFAGGVLPSGIVSFAPGQATAFVTVNVQGDLTYEADNGFTVTLSNPVNAVLGTSTTGTTLNESVSGGFGIVERFYTLAGSGGAFTLTYQMQGIPDRADVYVNGTLAASTNGPVSYGGTLSIQAASLSAGDTIRVVITGTESGTVWDYTVSYQGGLQTIDYVAAGIILNDDAQATAPLLSIAVASPSVTEGHSGATPYSFSVIRSGDIAASCSVNWAITGSPPAQAHGDDFAGGTTYPTGTLNFNAGQTVAAVAVYIQGDTTFEPDEGFTIALSNPVGAALGTYIATGTIVNDDQPPLAPSLSIAAANAARSEGNSGSTPFTFTLTRTGDLGAASSASWSVAGSGLIPANGADFVGGALPSGTASFTAGQSTATVTIAVQGDLGVEPDEGFTVTLSNAVGATLGVSAAAGTIFNDEASSLPSSLSIAPSNVPLAEGNSGTTLYTFTVTRSGDSSGTSSASWSVAGGAVAPADGVDFVGGALPAGSVSFAAGQTVATVTVSVRGDTTSEANEGFTVTLSNPEGAVLGVAAAAATIANDDSAPTATSYTVLGTPGDDVLVLNGANTYRAGAGSDTYILSPHALNRQLSAMLVDTEGTDVLQFVDNMTIASSIFYANAVQITLPTGAVVQILNTSRLGFQLGANITTGDTASISSYAQFASALGVATLPASGSTSGTPNYVVPASSGMDSRAAEPLGSAIQRGVPTGLDHDPQHPAAHQPLHDHQSADLIGVASGYGILAFTV